MSQMEQNERNYRAALDSLRFSNEAKERMMNNLMNQKEQTPARRRSFRPLRTGLIAAAACAALLGTAGAANVIARQANINFLGSYGEAENTQKAQQGDDSLDGVYGFSEDLKDYDKSTPLDMDALWNGKPGATLVEETVGTDGEGWTAKRVIQYEWDGKIYQSTMYKAEAPSGYNSLWKSWDTSWLEEHYTSTAQTFFEQVETGGKIDQISVLGEFRGQGDTVFNVQYSWIGGVTFGDQNYLREEYDHIETYTTADGVKVTIMTAPSNSGKTLFWAQMLSGGGYFSMFGTQVELDELYAILDSLNLSNLLEYEPVG